jgi:hypothetical protein
MIRYTLVHAPGVDDELARLWLTAKDRPAATHASDEIDAQLRFDAKSKGEAVGRRLRKLVVQPLVAYFTVSQNDRMATIWSIRKAR